MPNPPNTAPYGPDDSDLVAHVKRIRNLIRDLTGKPPLPNEE